MAMLSQQPNRVPRVAPPHLTKTFHVLAPIDPTAPVVPCEEADCGNYLRGFKVIVLDESDPVWQMRVDYFRNKLNPRCDRRYREYRDEHGSLVFEFEAGQQCFTTHTRRRDDIYLVRRGFVNHFVGKPRVHKNPDFFVEELHESVDTALTDKQKG